MENEGNFDERYFGEEHEGIDPHLSETREKMSLNLDGLLKLIKFITTSKTKIGKKKKDTPGLIEY